MPSNGDHLASTVTALGDLRVAVEALTDELAAVRAELEEINGKTPVLVGGKLPVRAEVDGTVQMATNQLPASLSNGKVRVTGLL